MKQYKNWWTPDYDTEAVDYVVNEWLQKGKKILDMCEQKRNVIQAGGNLGIFPAKLSEHFDTVHTFEPVDHNYECMIKNLEGLSNIRSHQQGLSNHEHHAHIDWQAPKNCGAIRLAEADAGMHMITIDSLGLTDVDLLWLDLEGYEYKALQGAIHTLKQSKPVVVLENNGLIHEYQSSNAGSDSFRKTMYREFGYRQVTRLMRDDVYVAA